MSLIVNASRPALLQGRGIFWVDGKQAGGLSAAGVAGEATADNYGRVRSWPLHS